MGLVRILRINDDYEPQLGRFKSSAFTASSTDHAISGFDLDCANATSGSACAHITTFYPDKIPPGGTPVYFWIFDPPQPVQKPRRAKSAPVPRHRVIPLPHDLNDPCHRGIVDLHDATRKRFFSTHYDAANKQFRNLFRCSGGALQPV